MFKGFLYKLLYLLRFRYDDNIYLQIFFPNKSLLHISDKQYIQSLCQHRIDSFCGASGFQCLLLKTCVCFGAFALKPYLSLFSDHNLIFPCLHLIYRIVLLNIFCILFAYIISCTFLLSLPHLLFPVSF